MREAPLLGLLHMSVNLFSDLSLFYAACTQDEVNAVFDAAKKVHRSWAKTPLWKRAEYLHKVDANLKDNVEPMANALVKEIAKAKKDAKTEVVRSGDLIAYTAEEGVRFLGQGKLLNSDSFPGAERNKLCLVQKVSSPNPPRHILQSLQLPLLYNSCFVRMNWHAC